MSGTGAMIDKENLYEKLNEGILDERQRLFRTNLRKNMPLIQRHGGLRHVIPELAGKHVIVAGAGPSLEGEIPLMKKYQDRRDLVIIAADMALAPLVSRGVKPGYVFSCETHPLDFFGSLDTAGVRLMAFSCMSHTNLRKWRGPVSFYNWMLRREEYEELWREAGEDLGFVATGNIVTTQAVAFAMGCAIGSLALAGNDLAFRDRFYCTGSPSHGRTAMGCGRLSPAPSAEFRAARGSRHYEVRRGPILYYTNHQFLAARLWLEDLFKKHPVPVFDCSFPGCSEQSVPKTDLKGYLEAHLNLSRRKKRRKQ